MLIFKKIEGFINNLISTLTVEAANPYVIGLKVVIEAYITIWFMYKAYLIMFGKSSDPIRSILFDAAIKIIILNIVFSPEWIKTVIEAIDSLWDWAGGGISIYSKLDDLLKVVLELANKLSDIGPSLMGFHIVGTFIGWIILVFFGFFSVITILIIIGATVTIKILTILSPIMIFTLLFGWLKQIFSKWIELIINNTLTILIIGLLINSLDGYYKEIINKANSNAGTDDILYIGFFVAVTSIVLSWIVLMARGISRELTYVSIEHLPGQAAKDLSNILPKRTNTSSKNMTPKNNSDPSTSSSHGVRRVNRMKKNR